MQAVISTDVYYSRVVVAGWTVLVGGLGLKATPWLFLEKSPKASWFLIMIKAMSVAIYIACPPTSQGLCGVV